jgi:hypothetical protein
MISWDSPVYGINDNSGLFDDAYFRLMIKKSKSGTDPVVKNAYYSGIEDKLEQSDNNGNYNGSFTGSTVKYKIGSAKGYSDGRLMLDWNNDGNGSRYYEFAASPKV